MKMIDLTTHKFSNSREGIRKELINIFLTEEPGTGKEELTSRYRYLVKSIGSHEVYLQRPAQFNNGFDFTLNVSGINFNEGYFNESKLPKRSTTRPSHDHILDDLNNKKIENPTLYSELTRLIKQIYLCQNPNSYELVFKSGYPVEIILECVKWLFIEQDVTYWNYSGREMFYNKIFEI